MAGLPFIGARAVTVVLSVGIHAGVAASMAFGHGGSAPGRPVDAFEVEVEAAPPEAPPVPTPIVDEGPKDSPTPAAAPHPHVHPYPVAASHDSTPHPADADHHPADHAGADHDHDAPAPPAAAAREVATAPAPMPRFTMALGGSGRGATVGPSTGGGGGGNATSVPAAAAAAAPIPEASVTTRARLLSSVKATYPVDARAQEVEADVPLDIVLDVDGRVLEARPAKNPGYGFDKSAVDAVLRYRFAPAQKDGQAVRVRMRWVVQFRLE